MDISKPSGAVDHTISVVEEVGDLVSIIEADGVEDGPPPGPSGYAGKPIDVTYHGGQEVVTGGAGFKDHLGDEAAVVDQRGQEDLSGHDGVEEAKQTMTTVDADGEGKPSATAAKTGPNRGDCGELEGAACGGAELA